VAVVAEDQEVLGVDFRDDGAIRELARLRMPGQIVDPAACPVAVSRS
jgi:hypothetical protein